MKNKFVKILFLAIGCFTSCQKEPLQRDNVMDVNFDNNNGEYAYPHISDGSIGDVYSNGATYTGNVFADGGSPVTERGVCYNFSGNPSVSFYAIKSGIGTGNYECILDGLLPGYTYYLRSYAVNARGTVYGHEINFTTPF